MKRKDSFDADTKAGLPNGNCLTSAAMLTRDDYTFKSLQPFFGFGFFDPNVDAYGVARLKLRHLVAQLCFLNPV
jgi:hypothetical protein